MLNVYSKFYPKTSIRKQNKQSVSIISEQPSYVQSFYIIWFDVNLILDYDYANLQHFVIFYQWHFLSQNWCLFNWYLLAKTELRWDCAAWRKHRWYHCIWFWYSHHKRKITTTELPGPTYPSTVRRLFLYNSCEGIAFPDFLSKEIKHYPKL